MESRYRELGPATLLCPTPVVLVSCADAADPERKNMLTIAWAGVVNSEPPTVSISVRPERYSYRMIKDSGEFVVNLVDRNLGRAADFCGVRSGRDTDKAKETGLAYIPAPGMKTAPAVDGAPLSLSCRVRQAIPLGSHEMFLGEVVAIRAREDLMDEKGALHLEKANLMAYSHGLYQQLGKATGFFGWSVARPEVRKRRMEQIHHS